MKNITLVSASIFILIGTVLFAGVNSPTVHGASTGVICIIPSGASSCSSGPSSVTGTVGTRLRVSVFIQNSTALNGFDVTLLADHTILKPVGADLNGTVLPGPQTVLLECLSGILMSGATCSSTDTIDTLHFAVGSAPGTITGTPTTGLLFTAIYNIVGTASGTSLGFQTGCGSPNALTSDPPVCVTVANGTLHAVPEAVESAIFSTSTTPDFVMSASPSSITITAGSSATSTLSMTSINGFSGAISLTATVSPATLPVTVSPASVTLGAGQTVTSSLTISTSTLTLSTTYIVAVTGTSGSSSHAVTLTVTVNPSPQPDFIMTASPSSLTITAGSSGSSTITLSSLNGFTGTINLAASISPSGPAISLSASSITLSPGASGTSTLTVSTTSSTSSGSYTVIVSAVSGTLSHSTTGSVMVNAVPKPDFSVGPSGVSIGLAQGASTFQLIALTSLGGFTGSVTLTDSVSPTGLTLGLSPTGITLISGGTGNSTLTISTTSATPPGAYTVTITGTSGTISHVITISVTVFSNQPDFTITANPASLSMAAGSSGTSTISLNGVNGFNNVVFLTVSTSIGLTATINPTSTSPFGTASLRVTSNTPGSYAAQVTGTSGSLSHTTTVAVTVTGSGVGVVCVVSSGTASCPSSPTLLTGTPGTQLRISIFIQGSGALNGFDITLLADHTVLRPAGIDLTGTALPAPATIISECLSGVIIHGPSCSRTADTLELAAVGAPSQVTFPPTTGLLFTAIYNVTGSTSGTPIGYATGCSSSSISGTTTCVAIANGSTGPVPETVQTASFSTSTTPDFVINASPSGITINAGSSGTSTLSVTSINGFSGTVALNTTVVTGNLVVSINPTTVTLAAGQTATSIITISAPASTPQGAYSASIAGLSGSLFHAFAISVTVNTAAQGDFSLTTSPSSLSVVQGSSATSTATVTSLNGFTGTVNLAVSAPAGLTVSVTPASIIFAPGGVGTSTLTVSTTSSTPTGTYTVTLTGVSGSISHSTSITVTVTGSTSGDFTIAESPTFQAIPVASERQTIVTVTSVNGFSGNVNLVISPSSTAFACWFTSLTNTATIFVPAGGSANQFPTCGAGRPAGAYNATISGTSGSLSHSVILGVTITDYNMSAASVSFTPGSSGTSTVTLTSLFGLSGPVSLSVSTPSGLTGACPSSVTLSSGGTSTAPCTFSSTSPGTYGATITGTFVCSDCYFNGVDSQSTNITVTVSGTGVPDFSVSANPSSLTLAPGSSGTSTITVASINGFSGTVTLSVTHSSGIGAVVNPTSITGSGTAALSIAANMTGTFSIQLTGSSGTLSHPVGVSVTVASIGVVCIMPSGTASCPINPASLAGAVGTQLRVSIFIQGSAGLNGFDVTLLADHTILRPVGVDLTGTVLIGTPTIVVECLQGVLIQGSLCSSTDTINTLQLVATSALGSGITGTPTTGLLFTAIYNVTGTTPGIAFGFQAGCTNTSVSGGVCVTVANGTPFPVSETVETATFSNSAPSPDFSITASPSSLTTSAGTCATSTVTLTSINGFSGTIALTTSVSPTGPTATLSSASVALSSGGAATTALTVCAVASTPINTYSITVTATSGSISHIATVTVTVLSTPHFAVSAIPSGLTIRRGSTNSSIGSSTLTIASYGFTGTISISASITPTAPHIPTVKLSSTSVTLSSGGIAQVFLTVGAGKNTSTGSYIVTVSFASGSTTQTVVVRVTVVR